MVDNSEYGILVVDDEEPIVKNMRRVLRRKGFTRVVSALTGEQGIKLLETSISPFFLIMSDQRMPGMSGSEFFEKSILVSPESRRMMITGYANFDAIIDAVNKGEIHQYISKPWDNDDLLLRIMGELEVYKSYQERKRLHSITRGQNVKLYDLASRQKAELKKFTKQLEGLKQKADALTQALKEAKAQAEYKEDFLGLDELLSRTIAMDKNNLIQAFEIARKEVDHLMETVANRNKLEFSPEQLEVDPSLAYELDDDSYEIIDQITENVLMAVEPDLFSVGSNSAAGMMIDDYSEVPSFDELAFNDAFITTDERETALEVQRSQKNGESTVQTIDKILVHKGFLKRKDVSRIFAKLRMIEVRLLDREFARMLINRGLVSQKEIDRAFRKQLNLFKDLGTAVTLGDILIESEVITAEVRDDVMGAQDRPGRTEKESDPEAQFSSDFGAFVDLIVSEDRVHAYMCVPKPIQGTTDIEPVKALMKKRGIKYGIVLDSEIRRFLKESSDPSEKFVVAQGVAPSVGKPSEIKYFFNTDSSFTGKVRKDGSIDFAARGDIPFVEKGFLLAEKIPMESSRSGIDVFGETIMAEEVDDIPLEGGEGVELSEDGLRLTARITGQPSIDANGIISVLETFTVKGDVDFKTGNINFNGNVIVKGTIKEGITVSCEELTANEISGGIVRTRGNLKVSNGIINSDIQTEGGVQAKFIKRTKLYAFGNVMVTREIMESFIAISGALNNETGRITASTVAARGGMSVKQIGTETAKYSTVKIGSDDHVQWISDRFDQEIQKNQKNIDLSLSEKTRLDEEYNALHIDIANQTFAQEKMAQKADFLEKRMANVKLAKEKEEIAQELKELSASVSDLDRKIKAVFQKQDWVQQKIKELEKRIEQLSTVNKAIEEQRDKLVGRLTSDAPIRELKVFKKLYAGTRIKGPQTSLILKQDTGASKFEEIDTSSVENPTHIIHTVLNK